MATVTKIVKHTGSCRKALDHKEIKHVRRMVLVAGEHIQSADNEIYNLEVSGFKWETRFLRKIILSLKAMLPGAVMELEQTWKNDALEKVIIDQRREIELCKNILTRMCRLPNKLITMKREISRYKHILTDITEELKNEKQQLALLKEEFERLNQEQDTRQEEFDILEQENETLTHENEKLLDHIKYEKEVEIFKSKEKKLRNPKTQVTSDQKKNQHHGAQLREHEISLEKKKGHEQLIQEHNRYQILRRKYDQVLREKKELREETTKIKKEYISTFGTMQKQIEFLEQEMANVKRSFQSQLHDQKIYFLNSSYQEPTEKQLELCCDLKSTSNNQKHLEKTNEQIQMHVDQLPIQRETLQYRQLCEKCHVREQDENKEACSTTKYITLKSELDKMNEENRKIRGELTRCEEKAKRQEDEYTRIRSDMNHIIEAKHNELTEIKRAKEIQQQQLHEITLGLKRDIREINEKNSLSLQKLKEEKIQDIHSRDITNNELSKKIQQLQVEIGYLLQDRKKLEDERMTVTKSEQTTQSNLHEHIEKLRQEVYQLKNEKEKLNKELVFETENAKAKDEEYSHRNNYLQHKITMLQKEVDSLKADLEKQRNENQNELLQLKEKLKQNEILKQEMEVAKAKEMEILQNVSKMETIIEVKRNEINNLKMANEEQQKQMNDYQTELDKQRKVNNSLKSDSISKTKNARNQEELMSSMKEENCRLQKELDRLQNERKKWLKELTIEKENAKTKEE